MKRIETAFLLIFCLCISFVGATSTPVHSGLNDFYESYEVVDRNPVSVTLSSEFYFHENGFRAARSLKLESTPTLVQSRSTLRFYLSGVANKFSISHSQDASVSLKCAYGRVETHSHLSSNSLYLVYRTIQR